MIYVFSPVSKIVVKNHRSPQDRVGDLDLSVPKTVYLMIIG